MIAIDRLDHRLAALPSALLLLGSLALVGLGGVGCAGSSVGASLGANAPATAAATTLEELVAGLRDPRFPVREHATRMLLAQGPEALPLVRRLVEDDDPEVRWRALVVARRLIAEVSRARRAWDSVRIVPAASRAEDVALEPVGLFGPR